MKAEAVIRLKMPSQRDLEIVYKALMPETAKPATTRAEGFLGIEDAYLVLTVKAKDTASLRATLNAYLRWILAVCNVLSMLDLLV
ncbi:MAG: KEOPS complex subunit Pcc1 [Candidatus Bathyarchaeia archaeon]